METKRVRDGLVLILGHLDREICLRRRLQVDDDIPDNAVAAGVVR